MNWGYKITFTFVLFGALIIYMVVKSFQQNIDLVTEDYYQAELQYQEKIDKIENTNTLKKKISARLDDGGLIVVFPDHVPLEKIEGEIQVYRPSHASGDKIYTVTLDTNYNQLIKYNDLIPGQYKLKIDWTDGIKPYFQEIPVYIPGI